MWTIFVIICCCNLSLFFFCWKRGTLKERQNVYTQKTVLWNVLPVSWDKESISAGLHVIFVIFFWWISIAAFFSQFCWNLQGMCTLVKIEINIFCFSLVLKTTKIFALEFFRVFLTVHIYLTTEFNQIFVLHREKRQEFKYVEIFIFL